MIADCEAGKIDYILTKSISRFARNTVDCVSYVRKLREIGVYVFFERERLDTAVATSELILTVLAAVAQEESHSISENEKWAHRKRFQSGIPKWVKTYGFHKVDDEWVINEEQATGVRRIFELYNRGKSLPEIARILEREGIPSMEGGRWWPKTLATVLHNEKYMGDVAMQKCYTVDHLTHRKIRNDSTTVPSYYKRGNHTPIIERKAFELAQIICALNDRHLGYVQYPYYGFLACPDCEEKMVRFRLPENGGPGAWTCGGKVDGEKCAPFVLREQSVDQALRTAWAQLDWAALEKLAAGDSPDSDAARFALDWRKEQRSLKKIEYIFLDALIKRISFPQWEEAQIEWTFGQTSRIAMRYKKTSHHPGVKIECRDGAYYAGDKRIPRSGGQMQSGMEHMRELSRKVTLAEATRMPSAFGGSIDRPCVRVKNDMEHAEETRTEE